jgi:SpoVK/Ycf46/Vps4 family AAA+-type ATPase
VLSSNLKQNIDAAFTRRMEFILDFEEPGPAERAALWQCHLPLDAPFEPDFSVAELAAHFPVVGGVIRNAAVAAAFLAAADGTAITRRHAVRALRREYDKAGRAFPGLPSGMPAP